eukprot:SAG22_NODE_1857_length_3437_cov_3.162073_5_plen_338_part_00
MHHAWIWAARAIATAPAGRMPPGRARARAGFSEARGRSPRRIRPTRGAPTKTQLKFTCSPAILMVGRPRVLSHIAAHLTAPTAAIAATPPAERFRGGVLASAAATDRPLEFVDNGFRLGHADASRLPQANADGDPVTPLTPEQRYAFDTQGWVVLPGVLGEQEAAACRAYCHRQIAAHGSPAEGSPEWRALDSSLVSGPLQQLSDHPALVGFMHEFVAHNELSSQSCYGFRMESAHLTIRAPDWGQGDTLAPHNGSGLLRLPGDTHHYAQLPGRANSSLTCAIWELAPVSAPGGGSECSTFARSAKKHPCLTECGAVPCSYVSQRQPQGRVWATTVD